MQTLYPNSTHGPMRSPISPSQYDYYNHQIKAGGLPPTLIVAVSFQIKGSELNRYTSVSNTLTPHCLQTYSIMTVNMSAAPFTQSRHSGLGPTSRGQELHLRCHVHVPEEDTL